MPTADSYGVRRLPIVLAIALVLPALPCPAQDRPKAEVPKAEVVAPAPALTAKTAAYFSEDFAGTQMGADWKLVNADPQRWTLQPKTKSLLIITATGRLSDSKNLKNWLVLNKELPSDNFDAIVEASLQIQSGGNQVGMALFDDDQNFFWIAFQGYGGLNRAPFFGKMFQGKDTHFEGGSQGGAAAQPERILLKIEREENQYSGYYAFKKGPAPSDEPKWVKMGTLPWINFHGRLVLYASNFQQAPEVAAEFYSVQIRQK